MKAAERGEDIQPEQVGYLDCPWQVVGCPWLVANVSQLVRETTNILQVKVTSVRVLDTFDLLELIESSFHLILCFKHCNKTDLLRNFVAIDPDVVNQSYLLYLVTFFQTCPSNCSLLKQRFIGKTDPRKGDVPTPASQDAVGGKPYASKSQIVLMDEASKLTGLTGHPPSHLEGFLPNNHGWNPTKNDHFGVEIGGTTILGNTHIWLGI